jgi:hypothetical protein
MTTVQDLMAELDGADEETVKRIAWENGAAGTASARPRTTGGRPSSAAWRSEAKRLRQLEAENSRLKRLLAEAHLDNAALKDLLAKNW